MEPQEKDNGRGCAGEAAKSTGVGYEDELACEAELRDIAKLAIRAAKAAIDPKAILNPGVLIDP